MPDRIALIARRFQDGFNCSQIVLSSHAASLGLPEETALRIASPFGGGIARSGQMCGAVTGALMALGLRHGTSKPGEHERKEEQYCIANRFMSLFRERYGSLSCRDLLGCDIGTPEGRKEAHDKGLFDEFCPRLVADAIQLSGEMMV